MPSTNVNTIKFSQHESSLAMEEAANKLTDLSSKGASVNYSKYADIVMPAVARYSGKDFTI